MFFDQQESKLSWLNGGNRNKSDYKGQITDY